ncbi:DUF3641 domain-containing protein [Polaromonas sp.]|uniref:DUF3641 domain-containing protein n=1 Tax=Polaromonas sp. TaxID=1869339 RepID=UPI003563AB03
MISTRCWGCRPDWARCTVRIFGTCFRQTPKGESIRIADHCYGCTAGQGSSCGGALKPAAPQEAVLKFAPAGVL